jgi:hypothetical protein
MLSQDIKVTQLFGYSAMLLGKLIMVTTGGPGESLVRALEVMETSSDCAAPQGFRNG